MIYSNSIASIACYLGMCVLICVILLVCVNAIAFLNFRPKCGAIIQPKSGQTKLWPEKCMAQYRWNLVENVTFETRRVSLVYRHAHYRPCLAQKCHVWDTPCIAGVSSRSLSLMSRPMSRSKMSRLRHAEYRCVSSPSLSLMSRSILWPEYRSCHAMIFGTGYAINLRWDVHMHILIIITSITNSFTSIRRWKSLVQSQQWLHAHIYVHSICIPFTGTWKAWFLCTVVQKLAHKNTKIMKLLLQAPSVFAKINSCIAVQCT
jgi:hypothetical protein